MGDPYRDRRFSAAEVRAILLRATALAERDPSLELGERSLTRDEVERAAGDLGLPAILIARAIDAPVDEASETPRAKRSWLLGAPTRLVLDAEVAGEPSESDQEDAIEDIREALGDSGTIDRVGKTLLWKLTPVYGRTSQREVSVRLRSRQGRTRIVIEERRTAQAAGLFLGMGLGGGLGPMGGYIALIAKLGVVGLLFPLIWIPMMVLLARTIFVALGNKRERALRKLMGQLKGRAAHWTGPDAPVRVSGTVGAGAAPRVAEPVEVDEGEDAGDVRKNARGRS